MNIGISKSTSFILFLLFILGACSKDKIYQNPPSPGHGSGGDTTSAGKGRFSFKTNADLTGQPYHTSNLRAVVTIVNEKNEEVVKDKLLTLSLPNPVQTESIELSAGNYKLTAFRMEYGSVHTHFATPIAGSAKASLVQHPLALAFKVDKNSNTDVSVEVLKVQDGEKPQQYGYPSGAFDYGQEDANPYMKVKIRAIMKIGDIIYDSIPASIAITTWNDKGEMNTTYSALSAGINEVQVLKAALKYQFTVSKWGTNDDMTLNRKDVDNVTVYTLGGSKDAKKLKSERVYKQVNGTYVAETKNDYFYDATGKLSKIEYWQKRRDNTPYLAMTDVFEYSNGKASKIVRIDEENKSVLSITSFGYDLGGKIISIAQNDNGIQTNAAVAYFHSTRQEVKIHYTYPGKTNDLNYYMNFDKGNMVMSSATTSNNSSSEFGRYSYDFNINPYIHMNWPNLFLSNSSKNNMTSQQKEYSGGYPAAEPYSLNYTYDADGYPTEVIKHYKSYPSGNYTFSTKTVFVY